jgi:hypothetical protein
MAVPTLPETRRAELIAQLPEALRPLASAMFVPDFKPASHAKETSALLTALAFPPHTASVPLASTLTPAQRAYAELAAFVPHVPTHAFALPFDTWNRRRWLGIDPPGVLEQPSPTDSSVPLWWTLRALAPDARGAVIAQLALPQRLQAYAELGHGGYGIYVLRAPPLDVLGPLEGLGAAGAVAPALADFVVDVRQGPDWFRGRGDIPAELKLAVFAALVLGGHAIAPRWEGLLPLSFAPLYPALVEKGLGAIAEARRTDAVLAGIRAASIHRREDLTFHFLRGANVELATALINLLRESIDAGLTQPRPVVEKQLADLAKKVPTVRQALGGARPARPTAPTLKLRRVAMPAKLTPLLRKQLGWLFESADEPGAIKFVELFSVHDAKGRHLYDMHLYCGDDGGVFETGTASQVASFSQGGATGTEDAELIESLDTAYHAWRTKKGTAAGTARKKPAAPRPAPPARKATPRKTAKAVKKRAKKPAKKATRR